MLNTGLMVGFLVVWRNRGILGSTSNIDPSKLPSEVDRAVKKAVWCIGFHQQGGRV